MTSRYCPWKRSTVSTAPRIASARAPVALNAFCSRLRISPCCAGSGVTTPAVRSQNSSGV